MEIDAMSTTRTSRNPADSKILSDLTVLTEKMDLCHAMMNPGAADPKLSMQNESMLVVIGYLEACAPRMVELVEAAATGVLSEEVFAECLSVNDRLQKLLSDVDTAALTETTASTTAASAPAMVLEDLTFSTGQMEDLLLGDLAAAPAPGVKSTGEDEEGDVKLPAVGGDSSDDDFDAFFGERTTQG